MHKPWHSLLFGIAVFSLLGLISHFLPSKIFLGKALSVSVPSFSRLFEKKEPAPDITKVLEALNRVDTSFRIDKPGEAADTARVVAEKTPLNLQLQYRSPEVMDAFYQALDALQAGGEQVRVLHYGDSQIEGDRMTEFIRQKLQAQFGGAGPGLLSFQPLSPVPGHKVIADGSWERYSVFTMKDPRVPHTDYGVRAAFSRFKPYLAVYDTTSVSSASVTLSTPAANNYTKLRIWYGNATRPVWCEYYGNGDLYYADSLLSGGNMNILDLPFPEKARSHVLRFRGQDSPDFYALSLEGDGGVMVDNIAMRGSSGTFFHQINAAQLRKFYNLLNVRLIMLQFGGNTMPSIKDSAMAANYAQYMKYQIKLVKRLAPQASILFIGPADMSTKIETEYVTYPLLELVRDKLKEAVLESGCAYFDMYDAMGGRNSMPLWVEEHLAGSDYVHFTPKGARKIATVLYAAIINDYNKYLHNQ